MSLIQLFRICIIGSTIPPLLYLVFIGLRSIGHSPRNKSVFYFSLSMIIFALSMIIYFIKPFLTSDQLLLAEFSMGGGLILLQFGVIFYIEYLHSIYKIIPFFSKLFYYASAIGFISLLFNPWTIEYSQELQVFTQSLSDLYFASFLVQIFCISVILVQVLSQIKKRINLSPDKKRIGSSNRKINLIYLSYLFATLLIIIGLILPGSEFDSLGTIVFFFPQALILFRDKEFFIYLLVQKVGESTEDLHKSYSQLMEQSNNKIVSPFVIETATQALVTFIEKADVFLHKKENHE